MEGKDWCPRLSSDLHVWCVWCSMIASQRAHSCIAQTYKHTHVRHKETHQNKCPCSYTGYFPITPFTPSPTPTPPITAGLSELPVECQGLSTEGKLGIHNFCFNAGPGNQSLTQAHSGESELHKETNIHHTDVTELARESS